MNKKKSLLACAAFLLAAAFILIPAPASALSIRVSFEEIQGDSCSLYYALDNPNAFSPEQCLISTIDINRKMVTFTLDPSLENRISGLRLDLPAIPQLLCVKSVVISSEGWVKRQYNPCLFFSQENILQTNDINALDPAPARARVYISSAADDPYLVFSEGLCRQITDCYSHFRPTRLGVCAFLAACFFLARRGLFRADSA